MKRRVVLVGLFVLAGRVLGGRVVRDSAPWGSEQSRLWMRMGWQPGWNFSSAGSEHVTEWVDLVCSTSSG